METNNSSLMTPQSMKLSAAPSNSIISNSISKVRLIVRVRSFLPKEISEKNRKARSCISVLDQEFKSSDEVGVFLKDPDTSRNECYRLDGFFGQEDDNVSKIFYKEVNPLIPGVFSGCNATVFAYGATGSGKTYTMQGTDEHPGLMPLAASTILCMCQSTGSMAEISYYEVYLERCYDLLEVETKEIAILTDKDGQIHLRELSRVPVSSMSEFNEVFYCGIQRRKVAHTGLNDASSRSHGVLVITVSTPFGDGSGAVVIGKLNLIDLAGNEDNRRTCNEGIRLQESAKINKSLFALSNVIYALNNNKPRVPYRESNLTRILQDSLGGTSRALMVICLNPGEYQESVHTVSLASRSRHISNFVSSAQKQETPKIKVDMEAKLQAWLGSKGKTKSVHRLAPSSVSSSFKRARYHSSAKEKVPTSQEMTNARHRTICVPFLNLFKDEGPVDSLSERVQYVSKDGSQENKAHTNEGCSPSSDELSNREVKITSTNSPASSLVSEKKKHAPSSPFTLRKVLSPINNIHTQGLNDLPPPTDQICPLNEPNTPNTPFTMTNEFQIGTPLDKFSALSCTLKSSLIQEYVDFLNTASREELSELKGIGVKLAEYIVELRETSPLKSLSDLQKIGLSSKQVNNLFTKAARGIFS
ncbi:Kinesin domain-containing protein/HHH_3 domain-containing protein [Cephalotus follicularis]|uniref:Kinesin-like protein n=1 Tax=Cephalotus follicularis TaxID=3775 RepID=A0A1Q3BN70_CEPFO|nr:Kinesin domain-containing protein/HHH_3 domain-containing protein [Cephalotus follicularis]